MNSLWISHPTGNVFVRALLRALEETGWDYRFLTTLGFSAGDKWLEYLPRSARAELARRSYKVPADRLAAYPWREGFRLVTERLRGIGVTPGANLSAESIYQSLDAKVAKALRSSSSRPDAVYAYEDGALATFQAAAELDLPRVYDLPILYWESSKRILQEEALRLPEWEPTLGITRDSESKLERKTRELELADLVICPSSAVLASLPQDVRQRKTCVVSPFGSPASVVRQKASGTNKLRVLFAGQMTQRKGLADLFSAMKFLDSKSVELVVLGAPLASMDFYRSCFPDFTHEPPRNHQAVLQLMTTCDVLVLPSLVEGRALVQQEALACGLPLIVTENAGASDLIEPGRTGFLVPVRSPRAIAEKIDWFASNRAQLETMRECCQQKAAGYSWGEYGQRILDSVSELKVRGKIAAQCSA